MATIATMQYKGTVHAAERIERHVLKLEVAKRLTPVREKWNMRHGNPMPTKLRSRSQRCCSADAAGYDRASQDETAPLVCAARPLRR